MLLEFGKNYEHGPGILAFKSLKYDYKQVYDFYYQLMREKFSEDLNNMKHDTINRKSTLTRQQQHPPLHQRQRVDDDAVQEAKVASPQKIPLEHEQNKKSGGTNDGTLKRLEISKQIQIDNYFQSPSALGHADRWLEHDNDSYNDDNGSTFHYNRIKDLKETDSANTDTARSIGRRLASRNSNLGSGSIRIDGGGGGGGGGDELYRSLRRGIGIGGGKCIVFENDNQRVELVKHRSTGAINHQRSSTRSKSTYQRPSEQSSLRRYESTRIPIEYDEEYEADMTNNDNHLLRRSTKTIHSNIYTSDARDSKRHSLVGDAGGDDDDNDGDVKATIVAAFDLRITNESEKEEENVEEEIEEDDDDDESFYEERYVPKHMRNKLKF